LLIAAEAVFFAGWSLQQRKRLVPRLVDLSIFAALGLPAFFNLQAVFSRRSNWAAFVPREPLWTAIDWTPLPGWWWPVLLVVAGVGVIRSKRTTPTGLALLVGCGAVVPLIIAWLVTWTDIARLFFPRYLLVVFPLNALLTGLCILVPRQPWQRLTLGLLTIGVALWSTGVANRMIRDGRPIAPRGEDWRGGVSWLNEQLPNDRYPVLIWSGLIESSALDQSQDERLQEYCKLPLTSLYELDIDPEDIFPLSLRPTQLDPVAESLIVHRGGVWLVVRGERKVAEQIGNAIITALQKTAAPGINQTFQMQKPQSFGRVHVLVLIVSHQP
jgi:hypothetical protein